MSNAEMRGCQEESTDNDTRSPGRQAGRLAPSLPPLHGPLITGPPAKQPVIRAASACQQAFLKTVNRRSVDVASEAACVEDLRHGASRKWRAAPFRGREERDVSRNVLSV